MPGTGSPQVKDSWTDNKPCGLSTWESRTGRSWIRRGHLRLERLCVEKETSKQNEANGKGESLHILSGRGETMSHATAYFHWCLGKEGVSAGALWMKYFRKSTEKDEAWLTTSDVSVYGCSSLMLLVRQNITWGRQEGRNGPLMPWHSPGAKRDRRGLGPKSPWRTWLPSTRDQSLKVLPPPRRLLLRNQASTRGYFGDSTMTKWENGFKYDAEKSWC